MKKFTTGLLFACLLLLFTSCAHASFKVTMHENYTAEEVTMKVTLGGTTYSDLIFEINGREYTVIDDDGPTVNEPYFVLYSEGDGMDYVTLKLVSDTASDSALLSMLPQDGSAERVYTCPLDEMKPLTDWMASN